MQNEGSRKLNRYQNMVSAMGSFEAPGLLDFLRMVAYSSH